jgi:hypothetical protein
MNMRHTYHVNTQILWFTKFVKDITGYILRTGNQIQQRPVNAIEGGKIIRLQERTRKVLLCWALSESPFRTRATGSIFSRQIFCNNP